MKRPSMRLVGAISVCLAASMAASVQAAPIDREMEWLPQYGTTSWDDVNGVAVASHGIYAVGYTEGEFPTQTTSGNSDIYVHRFVPENTEENWVRQFGGAGFDNGFGAAPTSDGVAVVGELGGNDVDGIVRVYRSDASVKWSKDIATSNFDSAYGVAVAGGAVYVVGYTEGELRPGFENLGGSDAFLRKYTSAGDVAWTRQFGTTEDDSATSVSVVGSSIYVVLNTAGDITDGGDNNKLFDMALVKFTTAGARKWSRQLGTSIEEYATSVTATKKRVFIAGRTDGTLPGQSPSGDNDAVVAAYTPEGVRKWIRQFGTTGRDLVGGLTIAPPGVVAVGTTAGDLHAENAGGVDIFLRGFTSSGSVQWSTQFGSEGDDYGNAVAAWRYGVYPGGSTDGALFDIKVGADDDAWLARFVAYRPDAKAFYKSGDFIGNNKYSPTSQVVPGSVKRGGKTKFSVWLENDGEGDETYLVQGCANPPGVTVKFFSNDVDITDDVKVGAYETSLVAPTGFAPITVKVNAQSGADLATTDCPVTVTSTGNFDLTDTVKLRIRVVS